MQQLMSSRPVFAGILFMLAGMFLFSVNDVVGKWLVATYTVGQVLLIRSAFALAALAPAALREGRQLMSPPSPGMQALRVTLSTAEVALFYWAVTYLPLADTVTFYLAGPIYVALLAVPLLGEKLPARRLGFIALGFVGVVIALNPGSGMAGWPALIAIAGSLCFAGMMLTTRKLKGTPDTTLVFWQTIGALALGLVLAPFGWVTPTPRDFLLLGLLGVVALGAHMLTNRALKLAPASVVVPYQYTLIVWAMILGWIVFRDVPNMSMVIGALVIVAAGVLIFRDEQRERLDSSPPADHP
jgi:drug/metabolite transporter (DMT)-like permease